MLACARPHIQRSIFRFSKSNVHGRFTVLVRGMRAVVQRVKQASVTVRPMLHQEAVSCVEGAKFTELTACAMYRLMERSCPV